MKAPFLLTVIRAGMVCGATLTTVYPTLETRAATTTAARLHPGAALPLLTKKELIRDRLNL